MLPSFSTPTHHKLQARTTQCVFLGYPSDVKGYKCLHPSSGRIYIIGYIVFDKNHFSYQHISLTPLSSTLHPSISSSAPLLLTPTSLPTSSELSSLAQPPLTSTRPSLPSTESPIPKHHSTPTSSSASSPPCQVLPPPPSNQIPHHTMLTHTKTGSLKPNPFFDLLHIPDSPQTPTSLSQALKSAPWREVMSQEFTALQTQGTWDLVPPPSSHTILGSRWTYRIKHHADGTITCYKARLMARGHKQQHGLNYKETFNPVAKLPTI